MRSIREVCSKDHSADEISGWGNRPFNETQRVNAIKNQDIWVIDNLGKIEGYGHLAVTNNNGSTKGHFHALYLVPEIIGLGLGKEMAYAMITEAKIKKALEINLESTLTAHNFYKNMGFIESGPQSVIELGDSRIRYIPMTVKL